MTMTMTMAERGGGCIILLDIPPGSAITLDGVTRVTPAASAAATAHSAASASALSPSGAAAAASLPFHRGLWIIGDVPPCSNHPPSNGSDDVGAGDFHLLVVRSGTPERNGMSGQSGDCDRDRRTPPVGFVLMSSKESSTSSLSTVAKDSGYSWIFASKYDQRTEEVSDEAVDKLTLRNLVMATKEGGELNKFVIPYSQFMGTNGHQTNNNNSSGVRMNSKIPSWEKRTSMINPHFLQRRHKLLTGNKIVPSSEGSSSDHETKGIQSNMDGKDISYPHIPCIDGTVDARRLTRHSGTRAYLSTLSPKERTRLLFGGAESTSTGEHVWKDVLQRYYGVGSNDISNKTERSEQDFLADIELSFLLFLFMECHASLEHWRDSISMCSLAVITDGTDDGDANKTTMTNTSIVTRHAQFFHKLLSILHHQLSCIETEFFREEMEEYSSGEKNFLVEALRRLCNACESLGKRKRDEESASDNLRAASQELRCLVRERFGLDLSLTKNDDVDDIGADDDMEIDALGIAAGEDNEDDTNNMMCTIESRNNQQENDNDYSEEDDEDGPVIVPYDQIEASLARSSLQSSHRQGHRMSVGLTTEQKHNSKEYPLLYAAMTEDEDEVMACARILDEAKDVSLVREAAAYLEEVEALRGNTF